MAKLGFVLPMLAVQFTLVPCRSFLCFFKEADVLPLAIARMAAQSFNALDDIFTHGKPGVHSKNPKELVFHCPKQNRAGQEADSANVLTFARPLQPSLVEDVPVPNSLTFEESDRPFRRFPQHLVEIMRNAERNHGGVRGGAPAPLCGIFTINNDSIAWVAVRGQYETTLVLFSANPERSEVAVPATHVEVEEIVSVCVVPQPSLDGANHLIAIATVSGVRMHRLLVCAASIVIDVGTNIFFSIPDVAVTSIAASDTGRLFAGCIDGWVYELQYMDDVASWWRPPKIRKVAPSVSGNSIVVALSYVPAPLFLRDRTKQLLGDSVSKQWKHMPVVEMCVHSSSIVKPSKVFLWALEKEETRAAGARAAERQYKTALQVYEVHATGLKLLHTFNDQDIKRGQHREEDTWISKIFPVEPWQEEEQSEPILSGRPLQDVARICAVFANGRRRFYKYDSSKSQPVFEYAEHVPSDAAAPLRNHDHPCCFHNGRFVRVNRDDSSVTSAYRSSFENARTDHEDTEKIIPAVSRTLRCAHPAGHRMQICVVSPVPPPPEIGRLIALQRQRPTKFEHVIPRTVHDAFWQAHSEQQDYLVMYSYSSDRCGITLVTEYSLLGRIRQAFRRQEADCHRSTIEDAFKRRIARVPALSLHSETTTIFQGSLIKATHLTLFIDSKISRNTSDMALQETMSSKQRNQAGKDITSNAWRFCVYTALSPLYRVPLFSLTERVRGDRKWDANPTFALLDDPQRWKRLRDFLAELLVATGPPHPHHFQVSAVKATDSPSYSHEKIREALQHVIEIASILFVLTHLFQRAPPLLVATSIKRKSHPGGPLEPLNTVEDLLTQMSSNSKAHHMLLEDVLDMSSFDQHLDLELRAYLQQYCPEYFREKQFLSAIKALTISQLPMDSSFNKLKLKGSPSEAECNLHQSKIQKEMSDKEGVLLQGNFDVARIDADMKLCALLLGYNTDSDLISQAVVPQFWSNPELQTPRGQTLQELLKPWKQSQLQHSQLLAPNPRVNPPVQPHLNFPFLFQAPVKFVCQQISRIQILLSQGRLIDDITELTSSLGTSKVSQIYKASLQQLLSMAFHQKLALGITNPSQNAVGIALFQDAVDAALCLNDKKCTEVVCDWLKLQPEPQRPNGGFLPLHVLHSYPDTEPFFAVIASKQYYPLVEEWISGRISKANAKVGAAPGAATDNLCSYYCCLLLEYLRFHNRWSAFCTKTLEYVDTKGYGIELDHRIAWLNMALNCTNGRTTQELPQKEIVVDQIQLRLKVLHLHKLAYDRLFNLLRPNGDHTSIKRWAIHFRMWNSSDSMKFFQNAAKIGPSHKFEDLKYCGLYDDSCLRENPNGTLGRCSTMLGRKDPVNANPKFIDGLLAQYEDDLRFGEVSFLDYAFFRKILSNSMFFDLEVMLLHTVLPIQNQQEISRCLEKMMVQSWFNDHADRDFFAQDCPFDPSHANARHWDHYCMRLDYHTLEQHPASPTAPVFPVDGHRILKLQSSIQSLRRYIHNFLEIAPKAQDTLRIMVPPEVLITFACTHVGLHRTTDNLTDLMTAPMRRHYVCAIADILLGYTSSMDTHVPGYPFHTLSFSSLNAASRPHFFVAFNALQPISDGRAAPRTKSRDRCLSLRNMWDALPHINRNLADGKFKTATLALAARLACETAASITFGISADRPAVDLAMQQYRPHHDAITEYKLHTLRALDDHFDNEESLRVLKESSKEWYDIIVRRS